MQIEDWVDPCAHRPDVPCAACTMARSYYRMKRSAVEYFIVHAAANHDPGDEDSGER